MTSRSTARNGKLPFRAPSAHGYFRVAACSPEVAIADPQRNAEATLALAREASERGAGLAVFPELGLSAYAIDDLLFQDAVLDGVERALDELRQASAQLLPILLVGAPLRAEGRLYNCAVAIHGGRFLAVVPKTYLPNYREFYEKRHFASGADAQHPTLRVAGTEVPFGSDILIEAPEVPGFVLHIEVCEDIWVPLPPSTYAALGGATVLANLSASNVTIAKAEFRRLLAASQSGRCIAAYVYTGSGYGESTTDLAWDGHGMVHENGELLAESERFGAGPSLTLADIDLDRLRQDRARTGTFGDCAARHQPAVKAFRRVAADLRLPAAETPLLRPLARFPFVPADPATLDARCAEAYAIQVQGLARRLDAAGLAKLVIGISGGLDSAQAALVCARVMDRLGLPRGNVLAYTMPGFATSERTLGQAHGLMTALGFTAGEIDIRPSCLQMLRDIDHPFARGEKRYDLTFENVQAGERTSHLFRLANLNGALVVGTSDLSELALGFTTYGVGDHMAHYAVNASVPKTLIRHLVRWTAASGGIEAAAGPVLRAILDTAISPELVPSEDGTLIQRSEDLVGPYALADFFLYYIARFGYRPSKVAYLAEQAWGDAARGRWPDAVPEAERCTYDLPAIKHWLAIFLRRFFATSQFKRSALPNGPKIGSGGSLSPRGDWRAPSDGNAEAWLRELADRVP